MLSRAPSTARGTILRSQLRRQLTSSPRSSSAAATSAVAPRHEQEAIPSSSPRERRLGSLFKPDRDPKKIPSPSAAIGAIEEGWPDDDKVLAKGPVHEGYTRGAYSRRDGRAIPGMDTQSTTRSQIPLRFTYGSSKRVDAEGTSARRSNTAEVSEGPKIRKHFGRFGKTLPIREAFREVDVEATTKLSTSSLLPTQSHTESSPGWGKLAVKPQNPDNAHVAYKPLSGVSAYNRAPTLQSSTGGFVSLNSRAPRSCYICKSEDHVTRDCPKRTAAGPNASKSRNPSEASNPINPESFRDPAQGARSQPDGGLRIRFMKLGEDAQTRAEELEKSYKERRKGARRELEEYDDGRDYRRGRNTYKRNRYEDGGDHDNRTRYRQRNEYPEDEFFEDRGRRQRTSRRKTTDPAAKPPSPRPIVLPEFISVSNLAIALGVRMEQFLVRMESLGFVDVAYDQILTSEDAGLIAQEYGFEPLVSDAQLDEDIYPAPPIEDTSNLPQRPPVVTIMGHVDHGKTTILDFLRKSSIVASEHGGITQHIGAFVVPLSSGRKITFLDTPGHAAFLAMRQRGANVTDIVILVVAADDSVKPQTIEAINHARAAGVPIIVAINKCDKEEANPDRVKKDLSRHGIDVEDFGGDTQAVHVSGKTGKGMQELEEAVVTLGEILDHRAPKDGPVEGWILESTTKGRGKVATVLVRRGTLRPGDVLVAGTAWTRVRTLCNEAGDLLEEVEPGTPAEVDGWKEKPMAGDEVLQASSESQASSVVEHRQTKIDRMKMTQDTEAINLSRRLEQERRQKEEAAKEARKNGDDVPEIAEPDAAKEQGPKVMHFLVRADVTGSAEAVVQAISSLGNNDLRVNILRSGAGGVTPSDVDFAATVGATILSFNVPLSPQVLGLAEKAGVKIMSQSIIYRLIEDVTELLTANLAPIFSHRVLGEANILQIFDINLPRRQTMKIAGCKVRNGMVSRTAKVRVLRNQEVIYDGTLLSLKNAKKDVTEMRKDTECGMAFDGWEAFEVGDQVQAYETIEEKRYL